MARPTRLKLVAYGFEAHQRTYRKTNQIAVLPLKSYCRNDLQIQPRPVRPAPSGCSAVVLHFFRHVMGSASVTSPGASPENTLPAARTHLWVSSAPLGDPREA